MSHTPRCPSPLVLALFLLPWTGLLADTAPPLQIVRITPSGEDVPAARQIVFQFDRTTVPVGRMERDASEIPIDIAPDPGCEWRWINTSALACQLGDDNPLLPATRYRIAVHPGIVAVDGGSMTVVHDHEFITTRPKITHFWFHNWTSPGTPELRVTFNQEINPESAARHVYYTTAGNDRIATTLMPFRESTTAWIVVPVEELPLDEQVALSIEPGIVSKLGGEPGVERRKLVAFPTFPEHRFLGVECVGIAGGRLRYEAGQLPAPSSGCDPLGGIFLVFSSPVIKEILRDHLVIDPDLAGGREDYDPWEQLPSFSSLSRRPHDHRYPIYLPEVLEADREYSITAEAELLRDEFDRPLVKSIDFRFRTDHRRPRMHLGHTTSVLESDVETHLPVVVTNLDAIDVNLRRFDVDGLGREEQRRVEIPQAEDVAFRFPLPVRDWLDGRSGAVVGHVRPDPPTRDYAPWFFSQVTPFHVHAKIGHYNSLVWVTDMSSGMPVEGADVSVVARRFDNLLEVAGDLVLPTAGVTDARGVAVIAGSDTIDPRLGRISHWKNRSELHLFVRVEKDGELALVPLTRDFMVETRRFVPTSRERRHGHLRSWGATAQGIYRAGDTVQYKIYVRNEGNETLTLPPDGKYRLRVIDPMGKPVHERKDIVLNDFGAFDGEFDVPETGAVGWYEFELTPDFAEGRSWWPMNVLVSDFTPAPFRVTTDLDAELIRDGDTVLVTSKAALHAGGPYVEAQTRVTATLRPASFRPEGSITKGFWFQTAHAQNETLHESQGMLDDRGTIGTEFAARSSKIMYGTLTVETAVRDDRGKNVAGRASARFAGRDRFVGTRQDDWVLQAGKTTSVQALVTDELGQVAPGTEIRFKIERRKTQASRVKGAGNAYLTHYIHTWESAGECTAVSADEAAVCEFTPDAAGYHRITVSIEDTRGRPLKSELFRWATGPGVVLWEEPPGHSLEIFPEKDTLKVGDTARYLVKNPFPGARALITIERFGVIKSWTETFESSTPIVEFPIEPDFLPGFYLSVVVTSPRVDKPLGENHVDLGKPAFRTGYVRVPVRDVYKELEIAVTPAGEVYKPRESVRVSIEASTRQGDVPPMEFAVAVLDESVLDLLARGTELFDPYEGFYGLGPLDLWNFNLLTRLIGIQKFEKKGANPGGGGGMDASMRSQFRFVSYWNPALPADSDGRAQIEFEVPDNLTAWRVLVMAVTPGDRMGLGQSSFRVNLPTEIRPALPNQVVEGDRFEARFTVMNRTDQPRTLSVRGSASGSVEGTPVVERTIETEPFKRYSIELPVTTVEHGEVRMEIRAGDASDADGLVAVVPVHRRKALEAAATYGTTTELWSTEPLKFPEDIRTDVGRVSVVTGPTVIGNVTGAFRYMRDYPYSCWEQRLTGGVMASHFLRLRGYLPEDFEWPEAEELPRRTLSQATNFQAPSGGMCFYTPQDRYVSPYLSAYTALAFQWLREQGHEPPAAVEDRLHDYLLGLLRKDVFPDFYSQGMASSVRAVALAALARSEKLTPQDLDRYRRHVPEMDLFGKAHYLQALLDSGGAEDVEMEVRDAILAQANESGGKIVFTEQLDDGYSRLMHSNLRSSCAVLTSLVRQGPEALEASGAKDLPFKLVRTITQSRGQRDRWENTQENMFCMNALVDYSDAYEQQKPRLDVLVHLDGKLLGARRFRKLRDDSAEFDRPIGPGDPGRQTEVRIKRKGKGRLYYAVRMFYSPTDLKAERINSGIDVRREYSVERDGSWIALESPASVRRGELIRVDLYVSLPAARNFVVVDDPVPGGLEPVNRDLATASTVDADKAVDRFPPNALYLQYDDWRSYAYTRWSFYHRELRHDSARFYSEYLPAGRYHLSYVAQVIAPGEFAMLPLHVEEMYDPDIFGQGLPGTLRVEGDAP